MEKFYMIIKLKNNQLLEIQKKLHLKDIEIKECRGEILRLEKEIMKLKNTQISSEYPGLFNVIDNMKNKWIKMEKNMQNKISERNNIFSELMLKKQEIKSIEMLIDKKEEERKQLIAKKEQDLLDELNSID